MDYRYSIVDCRALTRMQWDYNVLQCIGTRILWMWGCIGSSIQWMWGYIETRMHWKYSRCVNALDATERKMI